MCGRITLRRPDKVTLDRLNTRTLFETLPRHNIAPTQRLWAVTEEKEERSLSLLQWGLIPKTEQIYNFDWLADGRQLVLARGTTTSDVVLINNFK